MPLARSELRYAPDMNRKATWQMVSFWPWGDVGCGWTATWGGGMSLERCTQLGEGVDGLLLKLWSTDQQHPRQWHGQGNP